MIIHDQLMTNGKRMQIDKLSVLYKVNVKDNCYEINEANVLFFDFINLKIRHKHTKKVCD